MANFAWDPAWNIGQPEIDGQHQRWMELFNELETAFLSNERIDMTAVQSSVFKEMADYTEFHFASEEKLMRQADYPPLASHWRLHKEFTQIVYEKYRQFEKGELILTSEILSLIRNWLLRHIQVEDRKFGEYLRKKQAS